MPRLCLRVEPEEYITLTVPPSAQPTQIRLKSNEIKAHDRRPMRVAIEAPLSVSVLRSNARHQKPRANRKALALVEGAAEVVGTVEPSQG